MPAGGPPLPFSRQTGFDFGLAATARRVRRSLTAPFWALRASGLRAGNRYEHWKTDRRHNRRLAAAGTRILVVRHTAHGYNDKFLEWARDQLPELARRIELRRLPCRVRDWNRYSLLVPWLQDPLRETNPREHARARQLEQDAESRGIPIVNPVDRASVSIKSRTAVVVRAAGIRTPQMVPITDAAAFRRRPPLPLPFFVREDRGHGGPMAMVRTPADLANVPIEAMRAPIAVEFVDARGRDGRYRKYRYVLFGDRGVPRHLVISNNWVVHVNDRILDDVTRAEELRYLTLDRDPHHDAFVRARIALGLDWVAFDYAYDPRGELVVFEVNPFPALWATANDAPQFDYMRPCRDRLFTALADFLTERAGDVRLRADLRAAG